MVNNTFEEIDEFSRLIIFVIFKQEKYDFRFLFQSALIYPY